MRRQQGVALLVVLLLLSLMLLVASGMSARLQLELQRTRNLVRQDEGRWYALGGEALAGKVLAQDIRDQPQKTHLAQYWATEGQRFPLRDGELTGRIRDAQACFNLNAINSGTAVDSGAGAEPYAAAVFRQLLQHLDVDEFRAASLSAALRDWVDADNLLASSLGAEDAHYEALTVPYLPANGAMLDVSEVRALAGLDVRLYRRVRPLLCALPETRLQININTLAPERAPLLAALFLDVLSLEQAQALLEARPREGWSSLDELLVQVPLDGAEVLSKELKSVLVLNSHYFESRVAVQLDQSQFRLTSLFQRQTNNQLRVIRRQYGGLE